MAARKEVIVSLFLCKYYNVVTASHQAGKEKFEQIIRLGI